MKTSAAAARLEERVSIHPSAVIDPSVHLGEDVTIGAFVVVCRGVKIGNGSSIHSNCYIGDDCQIGSNTIIHSMVTMREKTQIGNSVVIESGVVIGSDGFGYAKEQDGVNYKVPQVGYVCVEDNVHIGANTTIDRATLGRTLIQAGAQVGSLVQVGHNVQIGPEANVGNAVGICGSSRIGTHVTIGQGVGMVGHIHIGDGSIVKDGAGVSKDVHENAIMVGAPAMPEQSFNEFQHHLSQLSELASRLVELEKQVSSLGTTPSGS